MPKICYAVEKPFRVYRVIGRSKSNAYYGSSQLTVPCYEAVNARPGDEIHIGHSMHLVRSEGGVTKAWPLSFDPPKHPFEKSYPIYSEAERAERMAGERGPLARLDAPSLPFDARSVKTPDLRDLHPVLTFGEDSPQLEAFRASFPHLEERVARLAEQGFRDRAGNPPRLKWNDFADTPAVSVELHFDETDKTFDGMKFPAAAVVLRWFFMHSMQERNSELCVPKGVSVPCFPAPTDTSRRLDTYTMPFEVSGDLLDGVVEHHIRTRRLGASPQERARAPK